MTPQRITAILLIAGAVLANVAFAGLGAVFNYPDILQASPEQIMHEFVAREGAIVLLFLLLTISAALIAPIAIMLDRMGRSTKLSMTVWVGVAAAAVQVIGLSRWFLIVPGLTLPADLATFETAHKVMGTIIGETLGYALTGLWTILVLKRLGRLAGPWFSWLGYVSAGLIILGVLIPLGVPGVDFANFVGYVLWSIWLIAFGVIVWRAPAQTR